MSALDWTPDEVEALLLRALRTGDSRGVEAALRVMAVLDPRRAETLLETIRLGLDLRRTAAPGVDAL